MMKIWDTLKLKSLSTYNKFKYRGLFSGIKERSITLQEACKALNVTPPEGVSERQLKAHYFISMKRMFYMKRSIHFTAVETPTAFLRALVGQGGIIVAEKQIGTLPTLVVPNLIEAYITLLSIFRNRTNSKVVAVTGSTGKTSTKNMCISTFSKSKNTFGVKYNMNTYPYCGSLLQCVKNKHELYVQEVDEGEVGFVNHASRIIQPNYSIVTNSGISHYKNFDSPEEITRNIMGITEGMAKDGKVLINYDDELLLNANWDREIVTVGFSPNADYYATNVNIDDEGKVQYTINYKNKSDNINLNVIGIHNIYNSMFAYAIAEDLGLPTKLTKKGIRDFKTFGVRQNLVKSGNDLLYIDCFNAAPASIKVGLKTISDLNVKNGGKKIAVLSEMSELGQITETAHSDVGRYINDVGGIDVLITYGKNAKFISDAVTRKDIVIIHTNDKNDVVKTLKAYKSKHNIIMFKGSRVTQLEKIIKAVYPWTYYRKVFFTDILLFHDI